MPAVSWGVPCSHLLEKSYQTRAGMKSVGHSAVTHLSTLLRCIDANIICIDMPFTEQRPLIQRAFPDVVNVAPRCYILQLALTLTRTTQLPSINYDRPAFPSLLDSSLSLSLPWHISLLRFGSMSGRSYQMKRYPRFGVSTRRFWTWR